MIWPNGKRFAFTVFDDTDRSTLNNTPPVYQLLADLGFKTTKSVWPLEGNRPALIPGSTCQDPEYLEWVLSLQGQGFEIGFHNATFHSSSRNETVSALDRFKSLFGHDPFTCANHASNAEAIYWGRARFSGIHAHIYDAFHGFRGRARFRGHCEGDPMFWGDLCRNRVRYFRNFVFRDIDTLKQCPAMPYFDPQRPYVNLWFASSDGDTVDSFCDTVSEANQDRLEEHGSACIMYTHFGKGFCEDGVVHPRFERLMRRLSQRNGWFPTTYELLEHLRANGGGQKIQNAEKLRMERQWLKERAIKQCRSILPR